MRNDAAVFQEGAYGVIWLVPDAFHGALNVCGFRFLDTRMRYMFVYIYHGRVSLDGETPSVSSIFFSSVQFTRFFTSSSSAFLVFLFYASSVSIALLIQVSGTSGSCGPVTPLVLGISVVEHPFSSHYCTIMVPS